MAKNEALQGWFCNLLSCRNSLSSINETHVLVCSATIYNKNINIQCSADFYDTNLSVDIGKLRQEMEVETQKLERDKQLLTQKMNQQEREAQVALKTEQQSHEEDLEKMMREKVSFYI